MKIAVEKDELKELIKEAFREIMQEREFTAFLATISEVSDEEQKEIDNIHGAPEKKKVDFSIEVEV